MRKHKINGCFGTLSLAVASYLVADASAQPTPTPYCGTTSGGKHICVQFDNRSDQPVLDTDFSFTLTDPPSVELRVGRHGGVLNQWRVWCYTGTSTPADISSISATAGDDFLVQLFTPTYGPGAANLGSITLTPSGNHYARFGTAGFAPNVAGNLTGNVTVKEYGGNGGFLSLVTVGDVASTSTLTIPDLFHFEVGYGSPATGEFAGTLNLPNGLPDGYIEMGTLAGTGVIDFFDQDVDGDLYINGDGLGQVLNRPLKFTGFSA